MDIAILNGATDTPRALRVSEGDLDPDTARRLAFALLVQALACQAITACQAVNACHAVTA